MKAKTVTIGEAHLLFLKWNGWINASSLYRDMVEEKMEAAGIDPDRFQILLQQAERREELDFEDLVERTDCCADLVELANGDAPAAPGESPDMTTPDTQCNK